LIENKGNEEGIYFCLDLIKDIQTKKIGRLCSTKKNVVDTKTVEKAKIASQLTYEHVEF
jgi:hypothetical protein